MGHRLSGRMPLSRRKLTAMAIGEMIVDSDMTIYTKVSDTRWRSETGASIGGDSLLRAPHPPLRPWKGPEPR